MNKKIAITLALCLIITTLLVVTGFSATATNANESTFQRVSYIDGLVNAADVNLREGTSTEHKVTCVLDKNTEVKILGKLDNWYALYVPSKKTVGVADSKYIKTLTENKPSEETVSIPAKVVETVKNVVSNTSADGLGKEERNMLDIINAQRKNAGVKALEIDAALQKVAQIKAKDLADNDYFDHKSPTYGSPFDLMRRSGIAFKSAGENLSGNESVKAAVSAWMDNNNHSANILNANYKYVGIGMADDEKYGKVYVAEFIEK